MLSRLILREESSAVADELRVEWSSLPDVLTVLLLLGGDVVQTSLAQLANGLFTPAVFSFGWVSYALSALLSAVGDNHLMPSSPDYPCLVINGESGYRRDNRSWVISRMLRDFDYWKDKQVEVEEEKLLSKLKKKWVPLSVSFYDVSETKTAGVGDYDFIWFFSYVVIVVQWGLATVPCALYENWSVLAVTIAGTAMAGVTAALPQWRDEKANACRKGSKKTFVITRGNGSRDVLVINGCGRGLDLEDLAVANARTKYLTRVVLCTLAILWIGLLITVAGIKQNNWYLFGVGGIGSLHNILVAGLPRKPGAYGIHLVYKETIAKEKVMLTLQAIEQRQPMLGRSLLSTFFPGDLREDEIQWWADALARARGQHGNQV